MDSSVNGKMCVKWFDTVIFKCKHSKRDQQKQQQQQINRNLFLIEYNSYIKLDQNWLQWIFIKNFVFSCDNDERPT